jgi:RNA polymerase sigma-70 factor (ECF subfamily)
MNRRIPCFVIVIFVYTIGNLQRISLTRHLHGLGIVFEKGRPLKTRRRFFRRKKEVSLEELSLQGFEPSGDEHERIVEGAAGREALAAVAHLEDEYRQIIVLRYVNDLSIGEIAEVTGETENVISVRIHRALKKLKSFLEHGPL